METELVVYLIFGALLLVFAYIVFRKVIRWDYCDKGRLTLVSSLLQLAVFALLMCFPYLFNPPKWAWFWQYTGSTGSFWWLAGLCLVIAGFGIAFGTMAWFGLRRAFGLQVEGLISTGPYRVTRNPQIIGGYLLVIGITFQWFSWYSFGWVILYGIIGHWMILTEEEHLQAIFGGEYQRYSLQTPRYLLPSSYFGKKRGKST